MKIIWCYTVLAAMITFCFVNTGLAQSDDIDIIFNETFTEITLHNGILYYYKKQAPSGAGNLAGPEEYIGQGTQVELTTDQIERLKEWCDEYKVFSLAGPDSKGNPESYEAAFFHRLKVSLDSRNHELDWTDADKWNDPEKKELIEDAVIELKKRCGRYLTNPAYN